MYKCVWSFEQVFSNFFFLLRQWPMLHSKRIQKEELYQVKRLHWYRSLRGSKVKEWMKVCKMCWGDCLPHNKCSMNFSYYHYQCQLLLLSRFSRVRLCDPIDGSSPGSAVPGILQARTLEQVAISFSNAWKWKVKVKSLSRVQLSATPWTAAHQAPPSMGFSRQEYWSGVPLPSPSVPVMGK